MFGVPLNKPQRLNACSASMDMGFCTSMGRRVQPHYNYGQAHVAQLLAAGIT